MQWGLSRGDFTYFIQGGLLAKGAFDRVVLIRGLLAGAHFVKGTFGNGTF